MKAILTAVIAMLLAGAAYAQGPAGGAAQGSPGLEEAARLNEQVVRLYAAGKFAEALPLATRVVELREKELGREHQLVAVALVNLATVEVGLGRAEEAKGHYRRAVDALEKREGESAATLIAALDGLARLESYIPRAIQLHGRSLALKEKAYGPDSREASLSHFQLGHLNDLSHNYDEAERHFRQFLAAAEKKPAGREEELALAYLRLACILSKKGRRADAAAAELRSQEYFDRVSVEVEKLSGADTVNGKAIHKPQPEYPDEAKKARAQGTIAVEILVGENGVVQAACARGEGHRALKEASEFAAYGARFTPTLVGGKPAKVRGVITYKFVLR